VGFEGHAVSPDVRRLIRDYGVGHVILFAHNVDGPEQVAELVRELQAVARDAGHALPLLVAVDQEGGRVARLREPWTVWPPMRAVGRTGSEDIARSVGAALAGDARYRWPLGLYFDNEARFPAVRQIVFGMLCSAGAVYALIIRSARPVLVLHLVFSLLIPLTPYQT